MKPENVPTARIMPNISSACLASSSEAEVSIFSSEGNVALVNVDLGEWLALYQNTAGLGG
jgi:hypothetical protein